MIEQAQQALARIAVIRRSESRVHLRSTRGQPPQEIAVKGWSSLENVDWTTDGQALFISSPVRRGHALLRVDLTGAAQVLWEQEQNLEIYAVPSPDGHHVAMLGWSLNSNIWMIERF